MCIRCSSWEDGIQFGVSFIVKSQWVPGEYETSSEGLAGNKDPKVGGHSQQRKDNISQVIWSMMTQKSKQERKEIRKIIKDTFDVVNNTSRSNMSVTKTKQINVLLDNKMNMETSKEINKQYKMSIRRQEAICIMIGDNFKRNRKEITRL